MKSSPVRDSQKPADVFERHFKTEEAALEKLIKQLSEPALDGKNQEKADLASQCSMGIARLTNDTRLAADILVAYFKRRYSERLKALSKNLEEARSTYAPRPKFKFNSFNRERSSIPSRALAPEQHALAPIFQPPSTIPPQSSTCITLPPASIPNSSLILKDIDHSIVHQPPPSQPYGSAEITNITSSLLLLGTIDGPARIRNLENSVLVVAAQQVRLHHCANSIIYLRCSSRPLVEFSSALIFAPLPDPFIPSSSTISPDNWSQIDDLQFQTAPQPSSSSSISTSTSTSTFITNTNANIATSPNWRFLDPDRVVPDEVWAQVLEPGSGSGSVLGCSEDRETVLGAVGVFLGGGLGKTAGAELINPVK